MKKVSKNKTKTKSKARSKKPKHYPVHYMVLALAILISAESFFATYSTSADWKSGFALLDVSDGVTQTISEVHSTMQPMLETASVVNEFYNQASIAATQLLTPTDTADLTMFISGVNQFYQQSADAMISLLDLTNYNSWQSPNTPQIAGAYISQ